MVGPEIKSRIKLVGVSRLPTLIIGQNPGHNKDGSHTGVVWEENKSAKLLLEALGNRQNLILTNICNYTVMDEDKINEGKQELLNLILSLRPGKVICLGEFAYKHAEDIRMNGGEVYQRHRKFYKLPHPSYIMRFNKDKESWIKSIREIIDERI